MYLKTLTLRGFKTFADKTNVEFNPSSGIIAVVGPNGCGKSNIVDSIRWVLGEQSLKEIRSSSLEDIIFAGTAARKPLSLGEVTLVIDNSDKLLASDYTEVSIKRRVFRSGESEFYINKNPCRLKDIKDLFLDTGLGKGAYSIINQGQVDAILSSKPEDRRAPFEEAAQISKYRFRKEAAQRKLISTEQNLLRINDLKRELSSQIKVLEEQAEKARQYKEIKSRLTELEIGLTKKQLQSLNDKKLSQGDRLTKISAELEEAKKALDSIEKERQSVKENLKTREKDIESAAAALDENKSRTAQARTDLEIAEEREKAMCEQLETTKKEIEALQPKIEEFEKKLTDKETQKSKLKEQQEAKERELADFRERLDSLGNEEKELSAALEELRSRILEKEREISEERNKLSELDGSERFAKEELSRDEKSIAKLSGEIEKLESHLGKATRGRESEEHILKTLDESFEDLAQKRKTLDVHSIEAEQNLASIREDLSSKTSRLSLLRSMLEEYQGFSDGVREIIKLTKNSPKKYQIEGVVADLIMVDEKHELAVETSLGANLQVIVTKSDATAKELIEYLRKENLGKAAFLPLNILRQADPVSVKDTPRGYIGVASELVKCDKSLEEAIKFLLGRTLVFDNLENALKFFKAKKLEKGARITTLTGELITSGGMISGGAPIRRTAVHLGRERELIALSSEAEEAKKASEAAAGLAAELKANIKEIEQEIEEVSRAKNESLLKLTKIRHEEESLQSSLKNSRDEFPLLEEGLAARTNEIKDIGKCRSEIRDQIKALDGEKAQTELKLTEGIGKAGNIASSIDSLSKKVTESRIDHSKLTHQLKSLEEEASIISDNLSRFADSLRAKEGLDLENKLNASRELIEKLRAAIPELGSEREELEQKLRETKEEKVNLAGRIEDFEQKIQESGDRERVLMEKLSKEEVSSAKIETEMGVLSQTTTEEYGLSVEEILASPYEVSNQTKAKEEVRGLKDRIKALGDVNLLAIEEFEKTKERLTFITAQTDDLTEARENLQSLISHLDQKARESFMETIRIVSENFSKIFAGLFEGGEAKIMLIEGDDILDAGIEIIARPHGKKWLSLELLSGGEKALTAIAILFALLRTHPSPFCFLDEVDAALDDANIVRFTRMLKNFSEDTQMIVITHSKRTMEAADFLYGVTMEEPGVSKLVSMKLAEV